ncbi:MAG: GDYXXLXY domain-containing protein [Clostridiales bacterium]|nr:GDYXXLXY domain-containing protein [Clostridiales bacterium]
MKKRSAYLLLGYFILQLALPGQLVCRHYHTLRTGESYKFQVRPYDPYDPFRGRYVALMPDLGPQGDRRGEYALLGRDADGYAVVTGWRDERPAEGPYVKDLQLDRYYMNEKMAPQAERLSFDLDLEQNAFYLLVKVRQGRYVIAGLYVNDTPIEQYLVNADLNG